MWLRNPGNILTPGTSPLSYVYTFVKNIIADSGNHKNIF